MPSSLDEREELLSEIESLRARLRAAESGLQISEKNSAYQSNRSSDSLHHLLLLSDSALPLGSFAFSSGLESFLAHKPRSTHGIAVFNHFLDLSICSIATLNIPYICAAYQDPETLNDLDNDLDASINCTVARRASIAQGRALISVWDRSFKAHVAGGESRNPMVERATETLSKFSNRVKAAPQRDVFDPEQPNGHLPPLFGVVCTALNITLAEALYVFLFSHVKTLMSAAVRASVLGPYQAQSLLATETLKRKLETISQKHLQSFDLQNSTALAGQSIPMLDLWGGRHEIIYSRIFNS